MRWSASLGLLLLAWPSLAHADREKAAAAYRLGTEAFTRGDFAGAATSFEAAFAADPRGASIYNAALSWLSAHDDARAADDFARASLMTDLAKPQIDNVKAQLAKLESALGKLTIEGPLGARASVAHASGSVPEEVHLRAGHYAVHAMYADGTSADYPVDVFAGTSLRVDVRPHGMEPAPIRVERPRATTGALGPLTLPVGITLTSAGVVAGGLSIGLGVAMLGALNEFNQSGHTSQSAHDRATALRDWTNVTLIGAVVLGGAGIAALATIHRVKVGVGVGSIVLGGAF